MIFLAVIMVVAVIFAIETDTEMPEQLSEGVEYEQN